MVKKENEKTDFREMSDTMKINAGTMKDLNGHLQSIEKQLSDLNNVMEKIQMGFGNISWHYKKLNEEKGYSK